MTPDCPLVIVEWMDSRQPSAAWRYLRDIGAVPAVRCASVGWLLHDTEAVKVLCPNMGDLDDDDVQGSGAITIPTCSIVSIRRLEEADDEQDQKPPQAARLPQGAEARPRRRADSQNALRPNGTGSRKETAKRA